MLVISLGIAATVCAALIALLSIAVGYPRMFKFLSYLGFGPARFFVNAMKAIEKIETLNEEGTDPKGEKFKFGTVKQGDIGFGELIQVLREKKMLKGEAQEIQLIEEISGITVGSDLFNSATSHEIVRFLVLLRNGKGEPLPFNPFDPTQATRELKDWTEAIARRKLAGWILVLVAIWFILNTYLVYIR